MKRILAIDDRKEERELLRIVLGKLSPLENSWEVFQAGNTAEAYKILAQIRIDLLVLDVYIGPEDGLLFLAELRQSEIIPHIQAIVISGLPRRIDKAVGEKLDILGFIEKKFSIHEMMDAFNALIPRDWGRNDGVS